MDENNSFENIDRKIKEKEINRLTGVNSTFGSFGQLFRFIFKPFLEPKKGILTDDEILKYAGDSRAASRIRLKRGIGSYSDKRNINFFSLVLMWIVGLVILLFIGSYALVFTNIIATAIFIAFLAILILYTVYVLHLKNYTDKNYIKESRNNIINYYNSNDIPSISIYDKKAYDLEHLYKLKEEMAIDLIEKRFLSNSLTYDKFITVIESSRTAFYQEFNAILTITKVTDENNDKINVKLANGIATLKKIIEKLDELTNELVINLNSSQDEEITNLLEDMENLIDSVKDYK